MKSCMKKLLYSLLCLVAASVFSGCQRYPYLYYYVQVTNAEGENLLCDSLAPGMINVYDLKFKRVYGDSVFTFVMPNPSDSVTPDSLRGSNEYANFVKGNRVHFCVFSDAKLGIKLEECPKVVIYWPDGKSDTLQIDNPLGAMESPDYYVNGKKVKSENSFITIVK